MHVSLLECCCAECLCVPVECVQLKWESLWTLEPDSSAGRAPHACHLDPPEPHLCNRHTHTTHAQLKQIY